MYRFHQTQDSCEDFCFTIGIKPHELVNPVAHMILSLCDRVPYLLSYRTTRCRLEIENRYSEETVAFITVSVAESIYFLRLIAFIIALGSPEILRADCSGFGPLHLGLRLLSRKYVFNSTSTSTKTMKRNMLPKYRRGPRTQKIPMAETTNLHY